MKNFLACLFLIIIGTTIYGLVIKGTTGNPTANDLKGISEYSLRDRGRYILTQNLVENRSFALNREQADLAAPDAGYYKGNWYLLYPPGLSVLAVPFYITGHYFNLSQLFTFSMGIFFAIGSLLFIFLVSREILKLPFWASIFASLVFGFGSTSLSYVTSLFQHHATAFLIISGFYAVYQYKIQKKWSFLWAIYVWFGFGLAIFIDYPNAVLLLPVMVYFLLTSLELIKQESHYKLKLRPSIILTSVFFVGIMCLHGYFNSVSFGGWTKLSGSLTGYREGVDKSLDQGTYDLDSKRFSEIQAQKNPSNFISENKLIRGLGTLLFALDRGLLIYNPIFILGIFGMFYAFYNISLEKSILIALVFVNLFFYSSWGDPWGGWAFGPRYLIPAMPLLAVFVGYFLYNFKYKLVSKITALFIFIFSAAVSLLGALTSNAVPPKLEAIPLKVKYGIPFNMQSLSEGKTNDFAFNYFFHNYLTLTQYWYVILGIMILVAILVIFILPVIEKKYHQ